MSRPHYPTIDLLRVIAVSMTVLVHTPTITGRVPLLRDLQGGLNLGVDLFMLISGWLLGGQLLRESKGGFTFPIQFYFKRWMRTLPPYYTVLVVLLMTGTFSDSSEHSHLLLTHALFVQEYLQVQRYGVSWSLCVEEHFYLILPFIVPLIIRYGNPKRIASTVVIITLGQLAARVLEYTSGAQLPYLSHIRSEGLFLGLGLAYISHCCPTTWQRLGRWSTSYLFSGLVLTLGAMSIGKLASNLCFYALLPTLGTWALTLVFIASVHEQSKASQIRLPGLRYLGELTYSIYLVHTLVPVISKRFFPEFFNTKTMSFAMMLTFALFLHHVIERPFLRLRTKILQYKLSNEHRLPNYRNELG